MSDLELYRPSRSTVPYSGFPATLALRRAELTAFRHGLAAAVQAECDRQDAQAVAEACEASLDCEMDLLDYGLRRANGSAAKAELVARKVERLAGMNDRRITRRFGR